MKEVAITEVKFLSPSGDCSPEMEAALEELHRTIEYHAKQVAQQFGCTLEIEER